MAGNDKTTEYDVVIAGAGAGGGFAAMVLAERGMRVLLLERGRRYDPAVDYPMNHPDWELQPRAFDMGSGLFDHQRGAAIDAADGDICSGYYSHDRLVHENPGRRGRFQYQRVIGVGGSTLHYQGEAHRFPEHAFSPRSLYGWGQDWPLGYAELAPWYARAEKVLGVAGQPGNPFKPERAAFPTPAHPLSTGSQLAQRGARKLGWQLLPNSLALPSRAYDGRVPCQHSGGCVQGCIFGAKSSVDLTAIRRAEATGGLQTETDARLVQIETGRDGRVTGFIYRQAGTTRRARARDYLLALGALETPRLLLSSAGGRHANGIGNHHDNVGRHFMETVAMVLFCQADQSLHSYKGPPIDARIWDFAAPAAPLKSGFVLGVSGTLSGRQSPLSYARSLPGVGLNHKQRMREQFGRDLQLFGVAEHIPNPDNRVMLSERQDRDGVPMLRLFSDYHVEDRHTLREMKARLLEWADACGLSRRTRLFSSYDQPAAAHVAGTCRMGVDPERSVTAANGRVHGVGNLYIADGSILPTLGAGDSPSLTIQALAMRIASGLGS